MLPSTSQRSEISIASSSDAEPPVSFYRKNYDGDADLDGVRNEHDSFLPTHSPPSLHQQHSSRFQPQPRFSSFGSASNVNSSSMDAPPSAGRFASGSFDPYSGVPNTPPATAGPGEDKVLEKQQMALIMGEQQQHPPAPAQTLYTSSGGKTYYTYETAGLRPLQDPNSRLRNGAAAVAPSNGRTASGGILDEKSASKYANLIPVQRPPTSLADHVTRLLTDEVKMLAMYTALSLFTRLYLIGRSPTVIWDEAHFGKFGSHYLKSEFYFDVHPPLGKMLVGLAGLLSGYNGHFEFKSGELYPDTVNYYGMRIIMALYGVAMVPVAWSSSGALGWDWRSRHLLALMVLCDNAWVTISRFILLDSMLLCFTFTTLHGLVMFHKYQNRPFTQWWWFWISFTGLSIGAVISVKWVGFFAMALVGIYTVEDLWDKFGDLKMPVRTYARHWVARGLCLIGLPLIVYLISFKLHFLILSNSGPGDAQMSSLFQAGLRGNEFHKNPLEIAYGSRLTFKNMGYGGGLLHSHVQTYPVGSEQQQVTCYHYKDENNDFVITPLWNEEQLKVNDTTTPLRFVKNGSVIRLVHNMTKRNLHSHNVAAPVTKENLEVSGYGNESVGDVNDYWVVEIVDDIVRGRATSEMVVHSLTTRMRFRHQTLGCYLYAANAVLPQWGWKQIEVSCNKENNPKDEHSWWNVESHWNDRLPPGDAKLYRSPFLQDFIHLNVAMMTSNNALIPDADKEDILASGPLDWPWLWNGLRMNSWADASYKYYLIGNPIIWWGSTASLAVFVGVLLWYFARLQRRHADLSPADFNQFVFVGKIGFLGWFLHYLPFLLMGRVTYIHHYVRDESARLDLVCIC